MPIVHVQKHKHNYIIIDQTGLQDTRLSYRARGILSYLLTKPDDWDIRLEQLAQESPKEGREAVAAALHELERYGYAQKTLTRSHAGRIAGWETTIFEYPKDDTEIGKTEIGKTEIGKTEIGKTEIGSSQGNMPDSEMKAPFTENGLAEFGKTPSLPRTVLKPKTQEQNQRAHAREESEYSNAFLRFWEAYPVKKQKDAAWRAWKGKRCESEIGQILASIAEHKNSDRQWRDGYTPHPATFLNGGGWKDELEIPPSQRKRGVVL